MKRFIALASLVALATSAASAATTTPAHPAHHPAAKKTVAKAACRVAPADEYFGKLKLSVLGIRNTIRDQGMLVDVDSTKAPTTLHKIGFAEDALRDWEHKYPCDRWVPWTVYQLEHFYAKIHTADGVREVRRIAAWARHDFPKVGGVLAFVAKDEKAAADALTAAAAPPAAPAAGAPVADDRAGAAAPPNP